MDVHHSAVLQTLLPRLDRYYWMLVASMPPALQTVGIGGNVKRRKAAATLAMALTAATHHPGGLDADVDGPLAQAFGHLMRKASALRAPCLCSIHAARR